MMDDLIKAHDRVGFSSKKDMAHFILMQSFGILIFVSFLVGLGLIFLR